MTTKAPRALRDLVGRLVSGRASASIELDAAAGDRTLSREAVAALGLAHQPFHDHAAPGDLFTDAAIEMQLNAVAEQLGSGEMIPLLKGEPGSGRTSQLIQLMSRVAPEFHYFVVRGRDVASAERIVVDMLRLLVARIPDDSGSCFRELARELQRLTRDGEPAVLVVDDADVLTDQELNHLLAAHDALLDATSGRFRVLFAVEPAFELRIAQLTSRHLDAGHISATTVRALGAMRVGPYLEHRLRVAGLEGELPFSSDEIARIAQVGEGLPRNVEAAAAAMLEVKCGTGAH